jgi:hypothetical protein
MICEIPLSRGLFALVDTADFAWLSQWKWFACSRYPQRNSGRGVSRTKVWMHREIARPRAGLVVDHIDGNPLNNTRANLRVCTTKENTRNCKGRRAGFKGVQPRARCRSRFLARIRVDGRLLRLGTYPSEVDAALAYDAAARLHFGEFARLNFPEVAGPT